MASPTLRSQIEDRQYNDGGWNNEQERFDADGCAFEVIVDYLLIADYYEARYDGAECQEWPRELIHLAAEIAQRIGVKTQSRNAITPMPNSNAAVRDIEPLGWPAALKWVAIRAGSWSQTRQYWKATSGSESQRRPMANWNGRRFMVQNPRG